MAFIGAFLLLLVACAICAHQMRDSFREMNRLQGRKTAGASGHHDSGPEPR